MRFKQKKSKLDFVFKAEAQTEKEIENAILDYLSMRQDVVAWKNQSVGIYDPYKNVYRKSHSKHHMNGVSDILGWVRGKAGTIPLCIEVKSKRGRVSDDQKVFIARALEFGCIAFVARSLDEVIEELKKWTYGT